MISLSKMFSFYFPSTPLPHDVNVCNVGLIKRTFYSVLINYVLLYSKICFIISNAVVPANQPNFFLWAWVILDLNDSTDSVHWIGFLKKVIGLDHNKKTTSCDVVVENICTQ